MIAITVNGRRVELEEPESLTSYLGRLGVDPRTVAAEVDGRIVERSAFEATRLDDGAVVEIVRMVGGGSP